MVLVSHRLSALQHADRVLVLDGGRVAERGTHADLLDRPGTLYGQLYRRQLLMQQLELDGPLSAGDPGPETRVSGDPNGRAAAGPDPADRGPQETG